MAEELLRFESPITTRELADVLAGSLSPAVEKTGQNADLEPVERAFQRLASNASTQKTAYDIELCEVLHKQLKHLPTSLKVDMRFWQWMTIKRFPAFVWMRWNGAVPKDIAAALDRSGMAERFLGNRSLRAKNRNALSRLFLTADMLWDKADGYRLAAAAFLNQDRNQAIFERELGLVSSAAKALIRATRGMGSDDIKKTAKRLNHMGSVLVLEAVNERELVRLLK